MTQKAYQEKKNSLSGHEDGGSKFPWIIIVLNILKQNISTLLNLSSVESKLCMSFRWAWLNIYPRGPMSNVVRTTVVHICIRKL